MAEKNETSLIGFDPLAWLNQTSADEPQALLVSENPIKVAEDTGLQVEPLSAEIADETEKSDNEEAAATSTAAELSTANITLEPVLNIRNVAELHQQLCSALENHNKIEIDASQVNVVDTASLQLLLILKQSAVKIQKEVVIDFPSEKFIEACDLLNLSEMLDVDHAASGFF